jgi:hypothetical protein
MTIVHWFVCPVRSRWRRRRLRQPFWRDDRVAQMFDIDMLGCPRCGRGAIAERDEDTCGCGHRSHLHDRDAVPEVCLACGDSKRCTVALRQP